MKGQIVKRMLGLRHKLGTGRIILMQKLGVQSAFRQVGVDPAKAAFVGYGRRAYLIIDLRLQFGWRGSPRRRRMIASAILEAQWQTTKSELAGKMLLNEEEAWGKWIDALGGVRRRLQRSKLHLNGHEESGGGGGRWGKGREKTKASRLRDLTEGFIKDVEW